MAGHRMVCCAHTLVIFSEVGVQVRQLRAALYRLLLHGCRALKREHPHNATNPFGGFHFITEAVVAVWGWSIVRHTSAHNRLQDQERNASASVKARERPQIELPMTRHKFKMS
jgi:hypothetical protein